MNLEEIINAAVKERLSEITGRYTDRMEDEVRRRLEKLVEEELNKHEVELKSVAAQIVKKQYGMMREMEWHGTLGFRLKDPAGDA